MGKKASKKKKKGSSRQGRQGIMSSTSQVHGFFSSKRLGKSNRKSGRTLMTTEGSVNGPLVVAGVTGFNELISGSGSMNPNPVSAGTYSSNHKILLVGEGSFTFAQALCMKIGGKNIVASSLDSRKVVFEKYGEAARTALDNLRHAGAKCLNDIDATKADDLGRCLGQWEYFDRVVFNFPHLGGATKEAVAANQKMLSGFFAAAKTVLRQHEAGGEEKQDTANLGRDDCVNNKVAGEIHVALRSTLFYDSWDLVQLAKRQGLKLVEKVPFLKSEYIGYEEVRTNPAARESPDSENAFTYKFAPFTDEDQLENEETDELSALERAEIKRKQDKAKKKRKMMMILGKRTR